jgi:integrase
VGLALRLVLLTGVRAGEAAGAALSEFSDLDDPSRANWVIPAERSKNGLAHLVPLTALAATTVAEAMSLLPEGTAHLFPSPTVRDRPITAHALAVAMARFSKALSASPGASTWTADPPSPHDLRRTFGTRLGALGIPGEDISALLNHAPKGVTAIHYNLYNRQAEKRWALTLWSDFLLRTISGEELANVVPLRSRKAKCREMRG